MTSLKVVICFAFVFGPGTAFARDPEVAAKDRVCKSNRDCTIAAIDCCGGPAVNKHSVEKYKAEFDREECAIVKCSALRAICKKGLCIRSHDRWPTKDER